MTPGRGLQDSETIWGVMHGPTYKYPRKWAYFSPFRVVAILHPGLRGARAQRGFGLPEALAAAAVLSIGLVGLTAVAHSSRRLAEIAATRTAQTLAARTVLEPADGHLRVPGVPETVTFGARRLVVSVDTARLSASLIEFRVAVQGTAATGPLEIVARRMTAP